MDNTTFNTAELKYEDKKVAIEIIVMYVLLALFAILQIALRKYFGISLKPNSEEPNSDPTPLSADQNPNIAEHGDRNEVPIQPIGKSPMFA